MADDLEKQGNKAIVDEEYELAVGSYSKAIELDPSNAELYSSRAAAYIKLKSFTDAVADANKAIELNAQSLPKAHLRKGIACFHLEEFQTARSAFEAGLKVDPTNSGLKDWICQCDAKLREEAAGNHQEGISSSASSSETTIPMETFKDETVDDVTPMETMNGGQDAAPEAHPPPQPPAPPKYSHDTYQTVNQFVVTFFAKNIQREHLSVDFGPQILEVQIKVPGEDEYVFRERLFGKIKDKECKYSLTTSKIEVKLVKAEPIKWAKLEYDSKLVVLPTPNVPETSKKYPSSTKKGATDWDKLEAEVLKQEKNEKVEGDAALNKLFQDIYTNADDDARRAMNKSFVESNGTVLSTNWKEVGSKEVEMSPPKDMEPKKWAQ